MYQSLKCVGQCQRLTATCYMCMHQWGCLLDQSLHFRSHRESRHQPTSVIWSSHQLSTVSLQLPSDDSLSVSQRILCMDSACMHVDERFCSPTTLSCTELTSCYCLLELYGHRRVDLMDSDIDWENLSQIFSQIQYYPLGGFEFITHAFEFYLFVIYCTPDIIMMNIL